MTVATIDRARRLNRHMTGRTACSSLALVMACVYGGPALAQNAFQGTPTVQSGNVTFGGTTGTDVITVATPQAVVDWAPSDTGAGPAPIDFLPVGNTALFVNDSTLGNDFTILNRIMPVDPTRPIGLNGTILSRFEDMVSGLQTPGGGVWFYAPGGFIIGNNAIIDVARLTLTTLDPARDGAGNFLDAANTAVFQQATQPGAEINIAAGATVLATPENSYVALVAPRIVHGGLIDVNGAAALVSAEATTITFNNGGLFDIQVTTGASPTGASIFNTGTITGPASTGAGDNHRIYMVAVPKNDAITLVVQAGSNLGFDIAGAADVNGNTIILSAGHDITGGFSAQPPSPGGNAAANLAIINANLSSALEARAFGSATIQATSVNSFNAASSILLIGRTLAQISAAGTNANVNILGNVIVSASGGALIPGGDGTGGAAEIIAIANGNITITGNATVESNGFGDIGFTTGAPSGAGTGGTTLVQAANGGDLTISGNLVTIADGVGGNAGTTGVSGGAGTGGNARFFVNGGNATATVLGDVFIRANGTGGTGDDGGNGIAGLAQMNGDGGTGNVLTVGGSVTIIGNAVGGDALVGVAGTAVGAPGPNSTGIGAGAGTSVQVTGDVTISAFSRGGNNFGTGAGGNAFGGNAIANIFGAGGVLDIGADLDINSDGVGGSAAAVAAGGNGTGGTTSVTAPQGSISVAGLTIVGANGQGGVGTSGGTGQGGTATVNTGGAGAQINMDLGASISASGFGGGNDLGTGSTGNAFGGTASLVANNGTIISGDDTLVVANGEAFGGSSGADGGNGTGGNASISQINGGSLSITGLASVSANGVGAVSSGGDRIGGFGRGGDARLVVNDADMTITGNASVNADGIGGIGDASSISSGGNGFGGLANIGSQVATLQITGTAVASAEGRGGDASFRGNGGDGTGGSALIGTTNGAGASLEFDGAVQARANGIGGAGTDRNNDGTPFGGGTGTGGIAQIFATNGSVIYDATAMVLADGTGGNGSSDANGGNGAGGTAQILGLQGSVVGTGLTEIYGRGVGGSATGFGSAGNATANIAQAGVETGSIQITGDLFVQSSATSGSVTGDVGNGGAATGGQALVNINQTGGTITITGNVAASANAVGGNLAGGTAQLARGGTANINARRGVLAISGFAQATASAQGSANSAGNGGAAQGGNANVGSFNQTGGSFTAGLEVTANVIATGGNGNGVGNSGGAATAGSALLLANGGNVTLNGPASILADAIGGLGQTGASGGNATGGTASISAANGQLQITNASGAFISAQGTGGAGNGVGSGGLGTGGQAELVALSSLNGPSLLQLVTVQAQSRGIGGAGGLQGNGGNGVGGNNLALGSAGNGVLAVTNSAILVASGRGGAGGVAAGTGGNATGGSNQFGTQSGIDTPGNTGSASFGAVNAQATAQGGAGGSPAPAGLPGPGGAGGNATGGVNLLLVRGSPVTITGNVAMNSDAFGGNGGVGAVIGNGGNAIGGEVSIIATQRFNRAERGTLTAQNISGTANTIGGTGATPGTAQTLGGLALLVQQSDATASSITLGAPGVDGIAAGATESFMAVRDGTLTVSGALDLATGGNMSVQVENATATTGNFTVSARNFIPDTLVTPVNPGTINAASVTLNSQQNVVIQANMAASNTVFTIVPGAVTVGNVAATNSITLIGAGLVQSGALTAGSDIYLESTTNGVAVGGAVTSGGAVELVAGSGNISYTAITAASDIDLDATGDVGGGNLTSGDSVSALAGGNLAIGNVSAGIVNPSADPTAAYSIAVAANGNVSFGSLQAANNIGVGANTGTLTGGAVTATNSVLLLANAAIAVGAVTGGSDANDYLYFADSSMFALGGTIDNFDPAPIFAAPPVATASTMTTGPLTGGNLVAASGQAFQVNGAASLTGPVSVVATTGDLAFTGAITSTQGIDLTAQAGAVTLTDATAHEALNISGTGNVTTGNLVSGHSIDVSGTNITIGTASAGLVNPSNDPQASRNVALNASGNVQFGAIDSANLVGVLADTGSISGGNVNAANGLLALARSGIALGSVTTGSDSTDFVYLANSSTFAATPGILDPVTIIGTTPVATTGPISIGTTSTSVLIAATDSSFTANGAITASQRLDVTSGGLASFAGLVRSPLITVRSGDLGIGASGGLGDENTTSLVLAASRPAILGGAAAAVATAYQIDSSEAARLRGQAIRLTGSRVDIRDLTMTGNAAGANANLVGANGRLEINASTSINVTGDAAFNQLADSNVVALIAPLVTVAADTGSLILSSNSPGGTLSITADNVFVATSALLSQLANDPNFLGRDEALGTPTGAGTASIQAHRFEFSVADRLLIQNNGTAATPAGFFVDQGEFVITPTGVSATGAASPLGMVIYGALDSPTGVISGAPVRDAVIGTTPITGFSATSSINGCLLSAATCVQSNDESVTVATDVRDLSDSTEEQIVTEEEEEEARESATSRAPIVRPVVIIDTRPLDANPLINEPVTGSGNPGLIGSPIVMEPTAADAAAIGGQ